MSDNKQKTNTYSNNYAKNERTKQRQETKQIPITIKGQQPTPVTNNSTPPKQELEKPVLTLPKKSGDPTNKVQQKFYVECLDSEQLSKFYLTNGSTLTAKVLNFDYYSVLIQLETGEKALVHKHAIMYTI